MAKLNPLSSYLCEFEAGFIKGRQNLCSVEEFFDQPRSFRDGIEAAVVWKRLSVGHNAYKMRIRRSNIEAIRIICHDAGYIFSTLAYEESAELVFATFIKNTIHDN